MREGRPRAARPWFALIAALVALGVGVPAAQSSPPGGPTIVNGEPAGATEFPAQSFLEFDIDDDGAWDWYCGGTLVAPTKILTAAHCATDFGEEVPAGGVTAYLGETDRRDFAASHRYLVSDVEVHANFNPNSLVNDVAMLTLASASPQQPLRVIRADETAKWAPGVTATIVGWGTTSYGGEESDTLLKAQVPIVSDASCRATYGSEFRAASMVCAYDGTHDTCQGDSGGPLMVPEDGGGLVLAGITSWGYGCADEDYPGVYTRIGATGLNTWIHSRLPASAPPPPPPAPPAPPPAPPPPPPSPPPPSPPPPAPTPPPPTPPAAPPPAPPPTPPAPPPPVEPAPQPQPRVVRCVVPRLTGRTLLSARRALARANCRLGRVTRSYSARVSFGRVIRQQPATGRRLARYARVSVVVSRGKRKR